MNAAEQFAWARARAMEYVDAGDGAMALSSLISDLGKHPGTAGIMHADLIGLAQGDLILGGTRAIKDFIEGLAGPRAEAVVCGVHGDLTTTSVAAAAVELLSPCDRPGTELVQFRCEKGHERDRPVCPAHADVLTRPRPDEAAFCVVCFASEGIESRLTPLVDVPARPPAPQHWRGEAAES